MLPSVARTSPSSRVMMSPPFTPALSAGEPDCTDATQDKDLVRRFYEEIWNKVIKFACVFVVAMALVGLAALSVSAAPPTAPPAQGDPQRGAYIFALSAGCGCHSEGPAGFLAGGARYEGPFGVVYASNITPDPDTGLGQWTDQQVIDAIRLGGRPDGTQLFPAMPYAAFSGMADQDIQDLVAFLRTVPPVENAVPARALTAPVLPFTPPAPAPVTAPTAGVERGKYVVNAISLCNDYHTPTQPDGSPDFAKFLAGSFNPATGVSPNITPDQETGIGKWTEEQIATFLRTGQEPGGEQAEGAMAMVIQFGYKDVTEADALAIAAYLETVPAVKNVPQAPPILPKTGGEVAGSGPVVIALMTLLAGVATLTGLAVRRWHRRA